MTKRIFDICVSLFMILLLIPLWLPLSIWIAADSRGGVFFRQKRIGLRGKPFFILKFRTMRPGAEATGQITIGARDPRITTAGYVLRKYKLDELPQLWNVLIGQMSLVGPRPEVPHYVDLYSPDQCKILNIKPGITDYASLAFFNENELLANADNPQQTYIEEIMPVKLKLNSQYLSDMGFWTDLKIIFRTVVRIFK